MQHIDRKILIYMLLCLPLFAIAHLISACDDSSGSASSKNQPSNATPGNNQPSAISTGTIAVSPGALFDFLHVATRYEFWNCVSSDKSANTYIALDIKDDDTDEGFNPLLLMGLLRESQLAGDPRALNEEEIGNGVTLRTIPVSFAATGSDSISLTLHSSNDFTPDVDDTRVNLTDVRTGPGRAFTAEDQSANVHLNCRANNIGADVML